MFNAGNIGRRRLESFIAERTETNHTDFYGTIKKNILKTFEGQKKIVTLKILNNRNSIRTDREIFAGLILIQQQRSVSLRDVLQLGLLSNTFIQIYNYIAPENSPKIFDGMVLLQKLPPNQTTLGEVSD